MKHPQSLQSSDPAVAAGVWEVVAAAAAAVDCWPAAAVAAFAQAASFG